MTPNSTTDAAASAVERLLAARTNATLLDTRKTYYRFVCLNAGCWGLGKVGKSHLCLCARSSEVRLKDTGSILGDAEPGKVVIPAAPMSVAYANFDRDASTVLSNLDDDAQIVEEAFYLDESGELIIPVVMTQADFVKLFERFRSFLAASDAAGMDLLFLDGGTVMWEEIRKWKLPTPDDGEKGQQPSEYQASNSEMRNQIMARMRGSGMHTIISREAREVWSSARGPQLDEAGLAVLQDDGWNKTHHAVELDFQMRLAKKTGGMTRVASVTVALKAEILGREYPEPTLARLYEANHHLPFLRRQDSELFAELVAEHTLEGLSWGA